MASQQYRVLIAVDGSVNSEFAVLWYLRHIHAPGYEVVLGHVGEQQVNPSFAFRAGIAIPKEEWQAMLKEAEDQVKAILKKHRDTLHSAGVETVKCASEAGNPGPHLVDIANKTKCQLIVIGTRGLSTMARTFLGSVSDYVLHHSQVPVCICPVPEEHNKKYQDPQGKDSTKF